MSVLGDANIMQSRFFGNFDEGGESRGGKARDGQHQYLPTSMSCWLGWAEQSEGRT